MNSPPSDHTAAVCDDGLNFCLYAHTAGSDTLPMPNIGNMGVVTLGPDGRFVSRRPLNEIELAQAWDEHFARHGLSA